MRQHPLLQARRREVILSRIDGLETELKDCLSRMLARLEPHSDRPGVAELVKLISQALGALARTHPESPDGQLVREQLRRSFGEIQEAIGQLLIRIDQHAERREDPQDSSNNKK